MSDLGRPQPAEPAAPTSGHPAGGQPDRARRGQAAPEPYQSNGADPRVVGGTGSDRGSAGAGPAGGGRGRPGRNLPAAFAVGGGLGAAVLVSLLWWRPAFLALIVAAVCLASWELTRAVRLRGAQPPLLPLLAGGAAMAVSAWFAGPAGLAIALLVTGLAILVWRLSGGPTGYQRDVGAALLIAMYVPFLAGFAALLAAADDGHLRVLMMLILVVLSDTGGYVVGALVGRRPMAPQISPKKSWEGLAGSLTAAAVGGAVGLPLLLGAAWWAGLLVGLLVCAAAVLGDLVESVLKRDLGLKDMSGLLPGHGGLMDRLDSILFAAPAAYLLLSVVAS